MPTARPGRRAIGAAGLVVCGIGPLAACGSAKLDRQQQEATSRECVSLLDRHAAPGNVTKVFALDDETLDLGRDPAAFYETLRRRRGPDAFPLDAPGERDTGRQDVVRRKCSGQDVKKTPLTTTTSTTTTVATTTDG